MNSAATGQAADRQGDAGRDLTTAVPNSVLHRWIGERERARTPPAGHAVAMPPDISLDRAAATALARAAEKKARLPVFVEKVELAPLTLSELPEILPERALLTIVEGIGDGLGVVAICPELLAALIEMQAMGRVTSRAAVPRKPTRTDAAISADFVNALLAELAANLARSDTCPNFGDFRYATYLDDPRPLALMLEDGAFSRLSFHFRIGAGGQRDGKLVIALPVEAQINQTSPGGDRMPRISLPETPSAPVAAPQVQALSLSAAVQDAPIRVIGVLCRRKMSLLALRKLVPGALIPLPQNVLDEARVETSRGQLLARGRLGEAEGFHAIRLRAADDATGRLGPATGNAWGDASHATPPAGQSPAAPGNEDLLADLGDPDPFRAAMADLSNPSFGLAAG